MVNLVKLSPKILEELFQALQRSPLNNIIAIAVMAVISGVTPPPAIFDPLAKMSRHKVRS